jgi:hypothetical protein
MIFKIILRTTPESAVQDARVHCVVLKVRAVPLTICPTGQTTRGPEVRSRTRRPASGPSGPNSVQMRHPPASPFPPPKRRTRKDQHPSHHVKCSTHELPANHIRARSGFWTPKSQMLLRKEVIQPHLPVRLPCYDLVLITDPTFDGSLHKG